jgi:crotonobetainyl-CoA:carnitine CoA-transferase CaiB-like acyl-CoA transferase
MAGPLHGIRVLDLTSVVMGPYATQVLGDLGADVIWIEDEKGDTNRYMGAGPDPRMSGVSMNLLRNKRNVGLDLKAPGGRDAFLRIAATCDVMVTNLRPAPLSRLRLAYDDVRAVKPDIVFCQAHGWPSDSPRADQPAYDDIIQTATGVADIFERVHGLPYLAPTIFADKVSALTIVYSVLAALFHRERTGEGQRIEVPMVEAMGAFMLVEHGAGAIPEPPLTPAGYPRILTPSRRPHRTTDGWIAILPYSNRHYRDLLTEGGRPEVMDDERMTSERSRIVHADWLYAIVADVVQHRSTQHWIDFCDAHEIPASPVVRLDELVSALPVVGHERFGRYHEIGFGSRLSATPASVRRHAPMRGDHDGEVLREAGLSDDEIEALRASGAIG